MKFHDGVRWCPSAHGACARFKHMLVQVSGSLPPASANPFSVSLDTTTSRIFLPRAPWHVACRMPRMAPLGELGVWVGSPGVLLHVRCVAPGLTRTRHANARCSAIGLSRATLSRPAISGHSARKPPAIAAPHRHTLCACASAKIRVACVQTGLCVPLPRVPHARSACTDPSN